MKNTIYLFVLLAFFSWSCADKKDMLPELPKYEVSFAVSAALASSAKSASVSAQQGASADAIYDEVEILTLFIYNSRGYLVGEHKRWRGTGESVFVTVLEEGDYTVIAVGNSGEWVNNVERLSTARVHKLYRGQVFMDKGAFKVGAAERREVNLMLKRNVGMLDLDITDQPTNNAHTVRVSLHDMPSEVAFQDLMPVGKTTISFRSFMLDPHLIEFPAYFFLPDNSPSYKTSVVLEVLDAYGNVRKSHTLQNVTLGVNRKTTIRGKLFDAKEHNFTVEVAEEWNEEETIDF